MEQEKVADAKAQFKEDCFRFKEFLAQINNKNKELEQKQEETRKKKVALLAE